MGANINGNNPAVEFVLQIIPDNQPAFKASTISVISEQSISKFQPGEEIFVKYDPENMSRVTIESS
ncbi:MAG: hypothetical protein Q9M91_01715 [Candidatus Dojkabacteria bacterium]|nr:hypothetical protein [Candidatus Dojkabacteria bacterium]MDQ7020541.1 hypothetical protein [Candidatus Dojkabacteria bacterium]